MIEIKNVTKTFDNFVALNDISLTVKDGSIYGLVGPNGSGKTTTLKHIAGIYRQDDGQVLIDGEPVYENIKIKSRMAIILDDFYYDQSYRIVDLKNFYKNIYEHFDEERYQKLKEVFDINEKSLIRKLSKGMQKQVAFWICMSTMPKYVILDEPVDGLDPVMRKQIWSLIINDVYERGTTVLVSSHNLRELEDVCDTVGIIAKGRLLSERPLSEIKGNLEEYFIKEVEGEGYEVKSINY